MGPFSNKSSDFCYFSNKSRSSFGMVFTVFPARSAKFVQISCLGRSEKIRSEKWCRFMVLLCRDQCFSSPLWPNKISEYRPILMHFVLCSDYSRSFDFLRVSQNYSCLPYQWKVLHERSQFVYSLQPSRRKEYCTFFGRCLGTVAWWCVLHRCSNLATTRKNPTQIRSRGDSGDMPRKANNQVRSWLRPGQGLT